MVILISWLFTTPWLFGELLLRTKATCAMDGAKKGLMLVSLSMDTITADENLLLSVRSDEEPAVQDYCVVFHAAYCLKNSSDSVKR